MVVPSLRHHLQRYHEADHAGREGRIQLAVLVLLLVGVHDLAQYVPQCGHSHADPDGEGVEASGECVVTLARLHRRLVQIEHYGDTGHEEQEEHHPELLDAPAVGKCLPQQAYQTQQQWKHVVDVVSLVVLAQVVGKQVLVAETVVVPCGDSRDPVAGVKLTLLVEHVVLTAGEVPHKVTPVHVVQLVVQEIFEVLLIGRAVCHAAGILHESGDGVDVRLALIVRLGYQLARLAVDGVQFLEVRRRGVECHPVGIVGTVHTAVDAREQHVELRVHLVFPLVVALHVIVAATLCQGLVVGLFAGVEESFRRLGHGVLYALGVHRLPFLHNLAEVVHIDEQRLAVLVVLQRIDVRAGSLAHGARVERFAVEQRVLAVLLTVQV